MRFNPYDSDSAAQSAAQGGPNADGPGYTACAQTGHTQLDNSRCSDFIVINYPWPNGGGATLPSLPMAIYTFNKWRVGSAAQFNQQGNNGATESFDWWYNSIINRNWESDFIEVNDFSYNGTGWDAGWANSDGGGSFVSGGDVFVDWTSYHTEEHVVTLDGSTTVNNCFWIDGTFAGCKSQTGVDPNTFNQRFMIELDVGGSYGFACSDANNWVGANCAAPNGVDILIRQIVVMACPDYVNSQCFGTLVAGP
jgi:hypothetical protein